MQTLNITFINRKQILFVHRLKIDWMSLTYQLRGHLSKRDILLYRQYFTIDRIVTREIMGITCSHKLAEMSVQSTADQSRRFEAYRSRQRAQRRLTVTYVMVCQHNQNSPNLIILIFFKEKETSRARPTRSNNKNSKLWTLTFGRYKTSEQMCIDFSAKFRKWKTRVDIFFKQTRNSIAI